jgi:hypothetical protein
MTWRLLISDRGLARYVVSWFPLAKFLLGTVFMLFLPGWHVAAAPIIASHIQLTVHESRKARKEEAFGARTKLAS